MSSEMYEPAIFTNETVNYSDFYAWFKTKLVAAGWENITSKYSSDGDVWHSKGERGTRDYFFSTFAPNANNGMEVRQYLKYTPGTSGVAGVFEGNPAVAGQSMVYNGFSFPVTVAGYGVLPDTTPLLVHFSINKERVIIIITAPEGLFTGTTSSTSGLLGKSSLWYIGSPELYSTSLEDAHAPKGLIKFGSYVNTPYSTAGYYPYAQIYRSVGWDTNIGTASENRFYKLDTSTIFRNSNANASYPLMDIVAGGPYEGVFARIKDVFGLPQTTIGATMNIFDGDLITDGTYTYRVVVVQYSAYRIYTFDNSCYFAIRVS